MTFTIDGWRPLSCAAPLLKTRGFWFCFIDYLEHGGVAVGSRGFFHLPARGVLSRQPLAGWLLKQPGVGGVMAEAPQP